MSRGVSLEASIVSGLLPCRGHGPEASLAGEGRVPIVEMAVAKVVQTLLRSGRMQSHARHGQTIVAASRLSGL